MVKTLLSEYGSRIDCGVFSSSKESSSFQDGECQQYQLLNRESS